MNDKLGLYKMLGVRADASVEQIKTAYRKRAVYLHPDKNRDDKNAEENFKKLGYAYSVLNDRYKRAIYDQDHQSYDVLGDVNEKYSVSFVIFSILSLLTFGILDPMGFQAVILFCIMSFFIACTYLKIVGGLFDKFLKEKYINIINNFPETNRLSSKTKSQIIKIFKNVEKYLKTICILRKN